MVEVSSAERANVAPLAANATQAGATPSKIAPDRRADEDAQILDGVQQHVGRPEPGLTDQARQQRQRRWPLRASGG
jgi:hypothetical protein